MTKAVIVLNDIFFERVSNRDCYNQEIIYELQGRPLTVYMRSSCNAIDTMDNGNAYLRKYMTKEGNITRFFASYTEFEIIMEK